MADKSALREAILAQLAGELELLTSAARSSRDEATDAENHQEGKFDMRAQSAAYLAAGQSQLAAELAAAIAAYRIMPVFPLPAGAPATIGALITLESGGQKTRILLGPARGGSEVMLGPDRVTVVTPASPLGRQLLGGKAGSSVGGGGRIESVE